MEYCIVSDDDAHDYVIPVDMQDEWNTWVEASTQYWRYPTTLEETPPKMPSWAVEIGGAISLVRFTGYRIA